MFHLSSYTYLHTYIIALIAPYQIASVNIEKNTEMRKNNV